MKRQLLLALLAAGLAAAPGCADKRDAVPGIRITPSIKTRVTGLHFDTGDCIGLTVTKNGSDYVRNHQMTYDVPQGFDLVRQNQDVMDGEVVENALFSDGLFTFTLYVNKADSTAATENTWKQGAYTIYSEVMGDKEITFIGQLPIAAAKRIVQGVTFLK